MAETDETYNFFRQLIDFQNSGGVKSSFSPYRREKVLYTYSHFTLQKPVYGGSRKQSTVSSWDARGYEMPTKRGHPRKRQRENIIDLTERPGTQNKKARAKSSSTTPKMAQFPPRTYSEELSAMTNFTNDFMKHFRVFVESGRSNIATDGFRSYVRKLDAPERRVDKEIYGYIAQDAVINPTISISERVTLNKKLATCKEKMCRYIDNMRDRERRLLTAKGSN